MDRKTKNKWFPRVEFRCDNQLLEAFDSWRWQHYRNASRGDVIKILMAQATWTKPKMSIVERAKNFIKKILDSA